MKIKKNIDSIFPKNSKPTQNVARINIVLRQSKKNKNKEKLIAWELN